MRIIEIMVRAGAARNNNGWKEISQEQQYHLH
jgi:hypothetical protein